MPTDHHREHQVSSTTADSLFRVFLVNDITLNTIEEAVSPFSSSHKEPISVYPSPIAFPNESTPKMFSCRASTISFLLVLLWNNCQCSTAKKDRNSAHGHRGLLRPYKPGPFENMKLSRQDLSKLEQGESVTKQTMPSEEDPAGGAICIQDVDAPKEAVWNQILDLDSYVGKVSKVNKCKNYYVGKNKDGSSTIKTKMVLGVLPGYSVRALIAFCVCLQLLLYTFFCPSF
jgi:hypothetical protein